MRWIIYDRANGCEADLDALAAEPWVRGHLVWTDLEGFAIGTDGAIYLLDECGGWVACDCQRFEIRWPGVC